MQSRRSFTVGYPKGTWDVSNKLPIVRRGITASPVSVDFGGQKKFLIDAPIYRGSSGEPVILMDRGGYKDRRGKTRLGEDRFFLLGIVAKTFFVPEPAQVEGDDEIRLWLQITMNLGHVFRSETVLEAIRCQQTS